MKKALYCLDRKEGSILVFENLETLEKFELFEEDFDACLCEGDIVCISFDKNGNAVSLQKDDGETEKRKEKNAKRLKGLFDKRV